MDTKHRIIVIVDDAAEDRAACRRYLRQDSEWKYTILEAASGEQALEICRESQPDCILLDYRLPDMDGLDVLTALTGGEGETQNLLPVVMLTGADEVSLAVEAMRAGAQDFINKNRLTPVDLQRAVRNAIARVELSREVREKELRFRTLTEAMPQLAWTCDADGKCDYLSRRWAEFTGRPLETDLGYEWLGALHPDDVARTQKVWMTSVASGSDYEVEFRLRRADGAYRWHLARALPIKDAVGQVTHWFGTCTDIEDRKQSEREREQMLRREQHLREQSEVANRLKDEFLAIVSHELRTPLHSILGWSKLLQTGMLDQQETTRAVDAVVQNAQTQAQLIEDLLDISGIVSGKLRLEMRPVNLPAIIYAAMDVVRPAAAGKGIELVSSFDPLDSFVSGDATRLQQAIWNLLSNAVKFTARGGVVSIRLSQCGAEAEVCVSDNGKGISAEFLPHVFDRFRQQDGSSTRSHGGLGLGLSIVKYMIEMHGGVVTAYSAGPEQGAIFTLKLPLAETREPEKQSALFQTASPQDSTQGLEGMHVLVVDDDPDAREMLTALLCTVGATVRSASNVADAIDELRAGRFAVIVSDIAMPGEDGYVLIRQARAMGISTPAVALTAYGGEDDKQRSLSAGYQAHLSKPVEPKDIIAVLAKLAGSRSLNLCAP